MSTSNTSAGFSNNGSGDISVGPSKIQIQNVFIDAFNKNTRDNLEFDLGSFRFDLNQFNFDLDDIEDLI